MPGDSSRTRAASAGDKVAISGTPLAISGRAAPLGCDRRSRMLPGYNRQLTTFLDRMRFAVQRRAPTTAALLQPLDDAQVAHGAVAECLQRVLVGRAVVRRDGLFDAGEFRDDDAL